jgi:hypothetical protein
MCATLDHSSINQESDSELILTQITRITDPILTLNEKLQPALHGLHVTYSKSWRKAQKKYHESLLNHSKSKLENYSIRRDYIIRPRKLR